MSIHVIETFIPTSTMVVVSWFSFLIPPESFPGRVAVLVTLLLVLINCMLKILDYSPVVGSCALSEWTLICLCMVRFDLIKYDNHYSIFSWYITYSQANFKARHLFIHYLGSFGIIGICNHHLFYEVRKQIFKNLLLDR